METNPKDSIGRTKVPMSIFPQIAVAYGAIGMLEGQLKYGAVNFRAAPVAASVYLDAALRHLAQWRDGQEMCLELGADGEPVELGPHLGNALACIAIILDARMHGTLIDDRPVSNNTNALSAELTKLRKCVTSLQDNFGMVNPVHYTQDNVKSVPTAVGANPRYAPKHPRMPPGPKPVMPDAQRSVLGGMETPQIPPAEPTPKYPSVEMIPMYDPETVAEIEAEAKRIYDAWRKPTHGWAPWVDHGNSADQIEARRQARARLGK